MSNPFVSLAKTLPAPLLRFFAKYPPAALVGTTTPPASTSTSSSTSATTSATTSPSQSTSTSSTSTTATQFRLERQNPFTFHRHPVTGKWHNPVYSARRQAQLVRMAAEHNVLDLLPPTPKNRETKLAKRVEHGLQVQGTGVGRRVKGHAYERQLFARLAKRRQAMLQMPKLIVQWRKTGNRYWKKFPK